MHICPYCQKLGISSFAAMGGAGFSRGLVSCRYCHNVSKRRAHPAFYFCMPIASLLFLAMFYFGQPPFGFVFFWLFFFVYLGLMTADRFIEIEKYQPPEKLPDPTTTIAHKQQGSANTTMLLLLTFAMLAIVPTSRAEGMPGYFTPAGATDIPAFLRPPTAAPALKERSLLHIDAESGLNPGFFRSNIQGPCGTAMMGGAHTLSGTTSTGHVWSYDLDSQNRMLELTVDDNRWTAFMDQNGNVTEIRDPANHSRHHTPMGPEQIKETIAAHRDEIVRLMSRCGIVPKAAVVETTKCGLSDLTFSTPDDAGPAPKDCYGFPDYMGDSGWWYAYWEPDFDVSAYMTLAQYQAAMQAYLACQATRQACFDANNYWLGMATIGCAAFWFDAPVAAGCVIGSGGWWGYNIMRCQTIICPPPP